MKTSSIISKEDQNHFWSVVRQCVRRFHADGASRALAEATRLRRRLGAMPIKQMQLFYHAEPFDVACNLAANVLDVKDYLDEYLQIRDAEIRPDEAPRPLAGGTSRRLRRA